MKKICRWLFCNLDKVCHFLVCVLVTIVLGSFILHVTDITVLLASLCGFVIAMIIGVLKEVFDVHNGGIFDKKDLLADFIGSVVGMLLALLII